MKKKVIKNGIVFLICAAAVFAVYSLLLNKLTIYQKPVSVITVLVILIVTFSGFLLTSFIKKENLKRFIKSAAVVCLIAFAVETFVFNFKSFTHFTSENYSSFSEMYTDTSDTVVINSDNVEINGNGCIYVDLNSKGLNALQLEFDSVKSNDENSAFTCTAAIKDGNFTKQYIKVGEKRLSSDYGKCDFSFNTYDVLQSVQINFQDINTPVTLKSVNFTSALPFRFSEIRFYALFLLLTLICAIRSFEFYNVIYDRNNKKHRIAIITLTAICSLSMFCFVNPNAESIVYNKNTRVSGSDPYVQMFDAVQNKRVNIDIEPSPELLEMENPYDISERSEKGISYAWDRAYYNGKYYSYYGIAPVITFYYPYYLLTNKLPSINTAAIFFGILSVIFISGTIMAFIKRFIKKPNFLLVMMLLVASCFASGMYFNVASSDMYALPGITGTCYLMLCLWCGFEACSQNGKKKQLLLFAVCGLAFALCLASKPTRALSALILAPVFLEFIFSSSIKIKEKVKSVASFMIPVLVGCGALMIYNYARFDSPFQFGAVYQLTVSNVNANGLKLSFIPPAIIQYFFHPVNMTGTFPFIGIGGVSIENRESYIYSDFAVGALTIPMILAGICVLPFLLHHLRKEKGKKFIFDDNAVKKITYIFILVMAVIIAWFNYCIAGIILSYVCDILPLLSILSVFVLLDFQQQTVSGSEVSNKLTCAISLTAVFTVILICMELIAIQGTALYQCFPNISYVLEDIVCFWN